MTARRAIRLPRDLYSSPRYVCLDANTVALLAWCDFAAGELARELKHRGREDTGYVWFVDALEQPLAVDAFFIGAKCTDPARVQRMLELLVANGDLQRRAGDGAFGVARKGHAIQTERQRKDAERKRLQRAASKAAQLPLPITASADNGADTGSVRTLSAPVSEPSSTADTGSVRTLSAPVSSADIGAKTTDPEPAQAVPSDGDVRTDAVLPRSHSSSSDQISSFERSDQKKRVSGLRVLELWMELCGARLRETGQHPRAERSIAPALDWQIQDDPQRAQEDYWRELFAKLRDNRWMWWGKKDRQGAIVPVTLQWILSTFRDSEGLTHLRSFEIGRYDQVEKPREPKLDPSPRPQTAEADDEKVDTAAVLDELRGRKGEFNQYLVKQLEQRTGVA